MAIWVKEYLNLGHRVSLFTLDSSTPELRVFRGPDLDVYVGRFRPSHRARDFFAAERVDLLSAMRLASCEVIHAHWTYEFAAGAIESGLPHVITAHDAPIKVLRYQPTPYRGIRLLMALSVARRAKCLTAVSPYIAHHYSRLLRHPGPIKVIPNGVEEFLFSGVGQKPRDEGVVIFATTLNGWGDWKNGSAAILAFQLARSRVPNIRLAMFGSGYGPNEAAGAWARARGLDSGIKFVGELPREELLKSLAAQVHVFVHPSLEESFSMAIAEAMALGKPVIAGDRSGGVPWTLEQGGAGLLVDVRRPEKIANAMVALASEPGERHRLGQKARESATKRFNLRVTTTKYLKLYEDVLSRHLPR